MKDLKRINLKKRILKNSIKKLFEPEGSTRYYFPLENDTDAWCIAMRQNDWEHVALDLELNDRRCPTYQEMCRLKEHFFSKNEVALQVHPRRDDYVNKCHYRLHLWRNRNVSERAEKALRQRIEKMFEKAKEYYRQGQRREVLIEEDTKVVLIFCGDQWLTWEEVCQIKQKYWQAEEAAVQFNISQAFDLNKERIIMLWDAEDFDLPLKEYV